MAENKLYDVIIVGGGVAGLSLSILLAKAKCSVLLIEKKAYPYHKVCGEYVSMESWSFLKELGLPLESMNLPKIHRLMLSSPNGKVIQQSLEMGGFGLSRYSMDSALAKIAIQAGVEVLENTTVNSYSKQLEIFEVKTHKGHFQSKIVCASFGKHAFGNFFKPQHESENWVAVKYHIRHSFPSDLIALHNFKGGYCGISNIEDGKVCLCYLVKASQLKNHHHSIAELEKIVLQKNPFLNEIFSKAEFLYDQPLTISNVKFSVKKPIIDHVFYLGDSAGTIAPLSGNGMSMALRSASVLGPLLIKYLKQEISFTDLERKYESLWMLNFKKRIATGRIIQHFFCKEWLTSVSIAVLNFFKPLQKQIIRNTHGKTF